MPAWASRLGGAGPRGLGAGRALARRTLAAAAVGQGMGKSKGPKWYAVRVGRAAGVYRTWEACREQVEGFSGAAFQSFRSEAEARTYVGSAAAKRPAADSEPEPSGATSSKKQRAAEPPKRLKLVTEAEAGKAERGIWTLRFDGGSRGNPGPAGGGSVLLTPEGAQKATLARFYGTRTNNFAEYTALLEGLRYAVRTLEVRPCCYWGENAAAAVLTRAPSGVQAGD